MSGAGPVAESERFGRPFRHFKVAISAGTQALAWARQEDAPAGALVVTELEVSPIGFRGRLWHAPPETTLACAMVLRPPISAEEGDVAWLVAGLAAVEGAEATSGQALSAWWPDTVAGPDWQDPVSVTKAEVQLGPGSVRSAVVTLRFDLVRLGLGPERRDDLLEAVVASLDSASATLAADEGLAGLVASYDNRCGLVGQRVKIKLLPKGELRGVAAGVDTRARLLLRSPTDMVERVTIDMIRQLEVV